MKHTELASLALPVNGGSTDHGYDRNDLAKRYNKETHAQGGRKVTTRKAKQVPPVWLN